MEATELCLIVIRRFSSLYIRKYNKQSVACNPFNSLVFHSTCIEHFNLDARIAEMLSE